MNPEVLSRSYTDSLLSQFAAAQDDNVVNVGRRQSSVSVLSNLSNYSAIPQRPIYNTGEQPSMSDQQTFRGFPGSETPLSRTTTMTSNNTDPAPTPLPRLQMFILCIILLSEPLTSTVLFPFIYFMLKDFNLSDDEKEIGSYAGWITSMFFVAQFCSAIPWGKVSDRWGRRPVLLTGLIGNSISACSFGLSKNLWWAIGTRAFCGIVNGNGGVARSMTAEITDETNRAKAFSLFGFCWGLGMIGRQLRPGIGGYLCKPAEHFPSLFGSNEFLIAYPYFLPCFVSSIGSFIGFILGFIFLEESNPEVLARRGERVRLLQSDFRHSRRASVSQDDDPKSQGLGSISKITMIAIFVFSVFSFHAMVFDEVLPLYFSTSVEAGGLGYDSQELAKALSIAGIEQLYCQFVLYPKINRYLTSIEMTRFGLILFVPVYFIFPELARLKAALVGIEGTVWIFRLAYLPLLLIRFFGNTLTFTSMMIIVNNSADQKNLGTVNGLCVSCLAFVRSFAPTTGGMLWSISLRTGNPFPFDRHLVYYLIGLLAIINLIQSYQIPKSLSIGGKRQRLPVNH
ncbi:major facilitator superfamily domain-containing protein [Dichotomocladium elegans]|nr:major facilitator superfamily domain-containing protein [Dichotomocladium elegans]